MRIAEVYSHLNGLEYLKVHQPVLWDEIEDVISYIDAEVHKTKISKEKTKFGKRLYAPAELNKSMGRKFTERLSLIHI